jgi:negative regulator of replication initiation
MIRSEVRPAIEIEEQLYEELICAAIQSGQSSSQIVRRAIENEIYWLGQYRIEPVNQNYKVLSNATLS